MKLIKKNKKIGLRDFWKCKIIIIIIIIIMGLMVFVYSES